MHETTATPATECRERNLNRMVTMADKKGAAQKKYLNRPNFPHQSTNPTSATRQGFQNSTCKLSI